MGFGDMQRAMRQVQKMQAEMARIQEEMAQKTVEASAGGGAVIATASGLGELKALHISAEALASDPEMVADLVLAACNEALRQAREMTAQQMARASGLPPGLTGLPGL
jgi:DNA-binding YbaB/EbfC family protein